MITMVVGGGAALGVIVWILAKIGHVLIKVAEALAAAAVVALVVWLMAKAVGWALRQAFIRWRTSLTVLGVLAWWQCWGWASLALTGTAIAGMLAGWRLIDLASFDAWVGRYLRAWWLRWTIYAPKLPEWLHACGLSIKTDAVLVMVLSPLSRTLRRGRSHAPARSPRVLGVRSGASW